MLGASATQQVPSPKVGGDGAAPAAVQQPRLGAELQDACRAVATVLTPTADTSAASTFGEQLDLTIVRVDEIAAMLETVRGHRAWGCRVSPALRGVTVHWVARGV